jgi:hypothetical protein
VPAWNVETLSKIHNSVANNNISVFFSGEISVFLDKEIGKSLEIFVF